MTGKANPVPFPKPGKSAASIEQPESEWQARQRPHPYQKPGKGAASIEPNTLNRLRKRAPLERRYGQGDLHFITCSCYQRRPLLRSARRRDTFLGILDQVRTRYQFSLVGYVVMPEHIHLLISEPKIGTPTTVMQVLKQRVSRSLRPKSRAQRNPNQLALWRAVHTDMPRRFWQRRFYDFNVWSWKKKIEKLNYMHMNPVERGLVTHPKTWAWSSYRFYQYGERNSCTPDR